MEKYSSSFHLIHKGEGKGVEGRNRAIYIVLIEVHSNFGQLELNEWGDKNRPVINVEYEFRHVSSFR